MAITETFSVEGLVSVERGEIDRRIFSDPDIFDAEMELIFGRAWQFLCHESQIPKAGDFVETPMGLDNVLAVRQKDGSVRGLLNTCMHRGNAVCRAEEGNTKAFMCTYHGWSYDIGGNLIGVPGIDKFYKGDLDMSQLGLRQVAQLESYHGFVFATLDPTAPRLEDYLGPTGRLGIDLIALRGNIEVIPGIQKFIIDCNWKFAVDNLFDWYHPQVTHMSAMASGIIPPDPNVTVDVGGAQTTTGEELPIPAGLGGSGIDEMTFVAEYGHAIGGPNVKGIGDAGGSHRPLVAGPAAHPGSARPCRCHGRRSPEHLPEQLGRDRHYAALVAHPPLAEPDRDLVVQLHRPRQPARAASRRRHGGEPHLRPRRPARAGRRRELVAEHDADARHGEPAYPAAAAHGSRPREDPPRRAGSRRASRARRTSTRSCGPTPRGRSG